MFYGWWIVILILFANVFSGATIWYGFTAFFNPLVNEFGWSYAAISLAASLRGVEIGLFDVFAGFLVDRFGGRRIVFAGSMLVGIGYLMLSQVNSLTTFYIAYIIVFCGATGLGMVVLGSIVNRWFSRRIGLVLGIISAGYGAGGLAVPGIVYLLDLVGLRMVFIIIGISAFIIGAFLTFFLRSRPEDIGYGPDGILLDTIKSDSDRLIAPERRPASPARHYTLKEAMSDRPFWIIIYVSAMVVFALQMVITHVMPYLEHIGYYRYTASIVAMMIPVMSIFGRLGIGWVSDLINRKALLILALVAQIAAMVLFFYARVSFFLTPFVILFGISIGGQAVLRIAFLRDYYGTTYIGSITGLCYGLLNIGGIFGPLLAGWLFDTTSSYSLAWIIGGISLISCVPLILIMKNPPTTEAKVDFSMPALSA
ncbi:MFS transporter [Chloroflexota bacterium]